MPTHLQAHLPRAAARQRGAALIFTAFFLLTLVATIGLAVEVGRLYAAQQRLQTAASLAALDAARFVSGCREPDGRTLKQIAQDTVDANYAGTGVSPTVLDAVPGAVDTPKSGPLAGKRVFSPTSINASAVTVLVENTAFKPLLPNLFGATGALQASAGAVNRPQAAFSLGTTLAEVKPELIGDLIGLNLAVASAGDLAETSLAVAELLGVDLGAVTQADVLALTVNEALGNISQFVDSTARTLVNAVAAQVGNAPLADILLILGETGADTAVSAGAIVNAAAQLVAANRQEAVTLDLPTITLPVGLGGVTADLRILEPPVLAVGPPGKDANGNFLTVARSAQVALVLRLNLELLATATLADVPIVLEIASGRAGLSTIRCPSASDPKYDVTIDVTTSTAKAGVGTIENNQFVPGEVTLLAGLVTVANSDPGQLSSIGSNPYAEKFVVSSLDELAITRGADASEVLRAQDLGQLLSDIDLTAEVGGGLPLLGSVVSALGDLIGDLLCIPLLGCQDPELSTDVLLSPLTEVLDLLAPVLSTALNPLLNQLGITLSSATVSLLGIDVDQPALFCTSPDQCGFSVADASPNN